MVIDFENISDEGDTTIDIELYFFRVVLIL